MAIPSRVRDWPGLERRAVKRSHGDTVKVEFFAGTNVEWAELIDHLEADPPSSPTEILTEFPAVSQAQVLGVLRCMAETMAYVDAWKALRLVLAPGQPRVAQIAHGYFRERLQRRAVVEAWRDEMFAAERTPEVER